MTKLNFEFQTLNSVIIPKLKVCKKDLTSAYNVSCSSTVPHNFKYYNYLKNLKNDFVIIKNHIEDLEEFIFDSNKKFSNLMIEMSSDISKFKNDRITLVDSNIKKN